MQSWTKEYMKSFEFAKTHKQTYMIESNNKNSFDLKIPEHRIQSEFKKDVPIRIFLTKGKMRGIVIKVEGKTVYFEGRKVFKHKKSKTKKGRNNKLTGNEIKNEKEVKTKNVTNRNNTKNNNNTEKNTKNNDNTEKNSKNNDNKTNNSKTNYNKSNNTKINNNKTNNNKSNNKNKDNIKNNKEIEEKKKKIGKSKKKEIPKMVKVTIENNNKKIKRKEKMIDFVYKYGIVHSFLENIYKKTTEEIENAENKTEENNSDNINLLLESMNINLTETQNKCISLVKENKNVKIIGPPGTGKTTTLKSIIKLLIRMNKSVLICANSNIALDNLAVHFSEENFTRLGSKTKSTIKSNNKSNTFIFATLYQSLKIHSLFDYVIVDECCYADELELLGVLSKGKNVVIAGDPYQLHLLTYEKKIKKKNIKNNKHKEIINDNYKDINNVNKEMINDINYKDSPLNEVNKEINNDINNKDIINNNNLLNEKDIINNNNLLNEEGVINNINNKEINNVEINDNKIKKKKEKKKKEKGIHLFEKIKINEITLDETFRCSSVMINWSNITFYNGIIKSKILPNAFNKKEILFVDTYDDTVESEKISKKNILEAEMAVRLQEKFGGIIISMYKAQVELISKMTDKVYTVDSFQGKECDTVIVSLVRTESLGFLKNIKRINVAVTRAKKQLIIIGDGRLLMKSELRGFINYLYENASITDFKGALTL